MKCHSHLYLVIALIAFYFGLHAAADIVITRDGPAVDISRKQQVNSVGSDWIDIDDVQFRRPLRSVQIDDHSTRFTYHGTWLGQAGRVARVHQTCYETDHLDSTASLQFNGSFLRLLADRQPWGGNADVYIDDQFIKTVSFHADLPNQYRQEIFAITSLDHYVHSLTLVCTGGGWVYIDAVEVEALDEVMFDDTFEWVTYQGRWTLPQNQAGRINGTTHETDQAGATVNFDFRSTTVSLIAERQPWGGSAEVFVDGQYQQAISFYSPRHDTLQQEVFTCELPQYGPHILTIKAVGDGWIYLDAVVVETDKEIFVDNADQHIRYEPQHCWQPDWSPTDDQQWIRMQRLDCTQGSYQLDFRGTFFELFAVNNINPLGPAAAKVFLDDVLVRSYTDQQLARNGLLLRMNNLADHPHRLCVQYQQNPLNTSQLMLDYLIYGY